MLKRELHLKNEKVTDMEAARQQGLSVRDYLAQELKEKPLDEILHPGS